MANLLERFTKPRREMGCFQQGNCMIIVTALWAAIYLLSIGGTQKGRRPPPRMGWGRRPYGFAVGIAPSADGALGRFGVFRPLRRAGISLAAASGYFAPCEARPGALPPGPLRFFEKNRVKLLTFFLFLTMAHMGTAFTTAAAAPTGAADQHKEQPAHYQSHQKPVQPRHRTNPTI